MGGRAALQRVVEKHLAQQQGYDKASRLEGVPFLIIAAVGIVGGGLLAVYGDSQTRKDALSALPACLVFLAMPWLLSSYSHNLSRRMEAGLDELKGYIRNVVFGYGLWRDIMEDDGVREIELGPLELGSVRESFEDRLNRLFTDYPNLATKKALEPFPGWYRKLYDRGSSKKDTRFVDHYWQLALAQVLWDEFFGDAPEFAPDIPQDSPELVENQIGL